MRTSLNKIKAIDDYLMGYMAPGDALLFEANIALKNISANDIAHQQLAYGIIRQYGYFKLKKEIAAVQNTLYTAPQHRRFMYRIVGIFKKF